MELICPECLGALATNGRTARCTIHGGEYDVLFIRRALATGPASAGVAGEAPPGSGPTGLAVAVASTPTTLSAGAVGAQPEPGEMCSRHPAVVATVRCEFCGKPLCGTCAFSSAEGGFRCPECATAGVTPRAGSACLALLPADARCVQHPSLPAAAQCRGCGAFMCTTCDFVLPGGVHVCPTCATAQKPRLSLRRKHLLGWSFALAVWCTVVMGALLSGAFASMAGDQNAEEALGVALSLLLFVPSLLGTALGVSAWERRLRNPPELWIAVAWNGLMLGGFLLLILIGLFSE